MTAATTAEALPLLRSLAGPEADFRPDQLEAIEALVDERRRVLCVQRTGWGKSAVYFIAAALLRRRGAGPALLVSPLIALMRNQVAAAARLGVRAETINTGNREEWQAVHARLERDEVDLLLVSPERLNNPGFRADVLPGFVDRVGLLVVDEAHCISDWGHDFRPDYRRIAPLVDELPPDCAVLCTTATANDRVVADIEAQLGATAPLLTLRGSLDRPALRLEVVDLPALADRLAWLVEHVTVLPGSGIVYCLTVRDTELVAEWLRSHGVDAEAYSGQSDAELRPVLEDRLLANDLKVVVATGALGMGYDKPDLAFVVHFQSPGSPIAYYQQVGRAGRALEQAHAVLLRGAEDQAIQDWFIDVAFPPPEKVEEVLERLAAAPAPVSTTALLAEVNVRKGRLEAMLKVLEVEGAVERRGGRWLRTSRDWAYDAERAERVTAIRRAEQEAMRAYARGEQCLMQFLRSELDDPGAAPCGRCAVCTEPLFAGAPARELAVAATEFVRDRPVEVAARKRWPAGSGLGAIAAGERVEGGRALSILGDAGWGGVVARARRAGGRFDDELVEACARLLAGWRPEPAPAWVTCVPSLRRPEPVPDFAARLAARLGLPFAPALARTRETPPQREMENSAQQALNVRDAFGVDRGAVLAGPVLLVDDLADSRWTLTAAGRELRRAGVPAVLPLTLAAVSGS